MTDAKGLTTAELIEALRDPDLLDGAKQHYLDALAARLKACQQSNAELLQCGAPNCEPYQVLAARLKECEVKNDTLRLMNGLLKAPDALQREVEATDREWFDKYGNDPEALKVHYVCAAWGSRGKAESAWVLFCSICTKRMREHGHQEDDADA